MLIGSMEMHRGLTFALMATILKQEFCLLAPGPLAPGVFLLSDLCKASCFMEFVVQGGT